MPLSTWGGLAQGISQGLENVMKIRNIQKSQEDEARALRGETRRKTLDERATEEFGQRKTLWEQQNKPTVDPMGLVNSVPDLDEAQKGKVATFVKGRTGLDLTKPISMAQAEKVHKDVLSDEDFVTQVKDWQRTNKVAKLSAAKERLAAIEAGEDPTVTELPPLAQRGTYQQQKTAVTELEKDLEVHNARDKAYLAAENLKIKQADEKRKETESTYKGAEEARKVAKDAREAEKPLADKLEEIIVLRDKYPKDSPEWKQYNTSARTIMEHQKELKKHEGAAGRQFAPSDTEKKFNFWKALYPNLSNAEIEKKVVKEDIPSETRYVLDAVKESRKEGGTPAELVVAEASARELYRKLTGGAPAEAPSGGARKDIVPGGGAKQSTGTVTVNGKSYTKILRDPKTGDEYGVKADGTREIVKKGKDGQRRPYLLKEN